MECFYFQPLCYHFLTDREAQHAISEKKVARLADKSRYFSEIMIWNRKEDGSVCKEKTFSVADIALSHDRTIQKMWTSLISPYKCQWMETHDGMPSIMGVLNVTPDSFSDGGKFCDVDIAISHAKTLIKQGAHCIDIGGESTRPGAKEVDSYVEKERVVPIIQGLADSGVVLSVDTRKSFVMDEVIKAGATVINDVSGLKFDSHSVQVIAQQKDTQIILMHTSDLPEFMQQNTCYDHVVFDVYDNLKSLIDNAVAQGVDKSRIIIDPGIGFGKTLQQNLQLIQGLPIFHGLGVPILLGTSRKAFIGHLLDEKDPENRVFGTIASLLYAAAHSAVQCVRVHDVIQTSQAFAVWRSIHNSVL